MSPSPKSQFRVFQYFFDISAPFAEGHICSQAEALVLNSIRKENIRNNVAKWITEAIEAMPEGETLTFEQQQVLQNRITEYDQEYQFSGRGAKARLPGPIELAAAAIAEEQIAAAEGQSGTLFEIEEREKLFNSLIADSSVQIAARQRIALRQKAVAASLEDLGL